MAAQQVGKETDRSCRKYSIYIKLSAALYLHFSSSISLTLSFLLTTNHPSLLSTIFPYPLPLNSTIQYMKFSSYVHTSQLANFIHMIGVTIQVLTLVFRALVTYIFETDRARVEIRCRRQNESMKHPITVLQYSIYTGE